MQVTEISPLGVEIPEEPVTVPPWTRKLRLLRVTEPWVLLWMRAPVPDALPPVRLILAGVVMKTLPCVVAMVARLFATDPPVRTTVLEELILILLLVVKICAGPKTSPVTLTPPVVIFVAVAPPNV